MVAHENIVLVSAFLSRTRLGPWGPAGAAQAESGVPAGQSLRDGRALVSLGSDTGPSPVKSVSLVLLVVTAGRRQGPAPLGP